MVKIEEKISLEPNVFEGALVDVDIIKFKNMAPDLKHNKSVLFF